ncbi:MAG: hypothetical protein ACRD25_10280 [Terracidiphilus sp.]
MTPDAKTTPGADDAGRKDGATGNPQPTPPSRRQLLPLPGLAAIALYMVILAGVGILGVAGGHMPATYLIFSAAFVAAGLGLLLMLRWAWALSLAAVLLLTALFFWRFAHGHMLPYIVQGLLNLVFFFYLIRTEVRAKLR